MMLRSLFITFLTAIALYAHPHVFIDTHVDVQNDKILIVWSFDEMTSSVLMGDYDKNKDQKLDEQEIAFMKKDHFDTLAPYNFFFYLFDGKEEKPISSVIDFTASFEKNRLVYIFSIPKPKLKKYELHFYDPEMYVAMIVKPEFLTCKKPITCKVEGYDADFYYGYKVVIQE